MCQYMFKSGKRQCFSVFDGTILKTIAMTVDCRARKLKVKAWLFNLLCSFNSVKHVDLLHFSTCTVRVQR